MNDVGLFDQVPFVAVSTWLICVVPLIVGTVNAAGTAVARAVTAAVGAETATVEPAEFVAVTCNSSVAPASAATGTYVAAVADGIGAHVVADVQRSHWSANVGAGLPVHEPCAPFSVTPTDATPVTDGAVSTVGATVPPHQPTGQVAAASFACPAIEGWKWSRLDTSLRPSERP